MAAVSDFTFEDKVLKADSPTVVMLWQRGCPPCMELVPVLTEVARDKPDMQFVLVNSQDNPKTRDRYGVAACPTLLLFKGGELLGRYLGAAPQPKVTAWIDRTVGA